MINTITIDGIEYEEINRADYIKIDGATYWYNPITEQYHFFKKKETFPKVFENAYKVIEVNSLGYISFTSKVGYGIYDFTESLDILYQAVEESKRIRDLK